MPLIRSISGLRGTIGDGLTPDVVVRYVSAFAAYLGGGPIVVGRDGRPSGLWVEEVVVGTLLACGIDAHVLGVAPTPTVQMATEKSDAWGGISITASHNPSEWNGLKFLNGEGIFLDPEECSAFFAVVDRGEAPLVDWEHLGGRVELAGAIGDHVAAATTLSFVDLELLRSRRFKVVVDAVNASGSSAIPALLEECGCEVIRLYCDGSGLFPHTPEPLPENLVQLAAAVPEHGADLGVAVDPDADRLVLIDERGVPIGEEYTITQAVDFLLGHERTRDAERELIAVVNLSTTRAVEDVAERHGARVVRTPVGEINVARRMKELGAVIGGEGSGGVILPELHFGRDSLAGVVITLMNLARSGGAMSALRGALPAYEIVKKKAPLAAGSDVAGLLRRVAESRGNGCRVTTDDGLKLDYERSWVHLRSSNTEPIVRVIAEAPTREDAEELAAMLVRELEGA